MQPKRAEHDRRRRRARVMLEWRRLPETPDPDRHQHCTATLVPKILDGLGLAKRFQEEEMAAAWKSIAGEFAARFSHPQKLRHRMLVVTVTQSAVLWTLDRNKASLLGRLQEKFGRETIRDLRFQPG